MAVTVDTGDYKVSRGDAFSVDPRALVIDWHKNIARGGEEPVVDDELVALARDMKPRVASEAEGGSSGQLNPVLVRMLPDRKLELIGGFRRAKAGLWLIESGECEDFKLKYSVVKLNDGEAALANMAENVHRSPPTPMQLARAVRSFVEDYQMTMDDIAARLKVGKKWLEQISELVSLPKKIQNEIESGKMAVSAGVELTKVTPEKQISVFDAAKASNGKVTASAVKDQSREIKEGPTPRTAKHIREFLEQYTGKGEASAPIAKAILAFLEGKPKSDEKLRAAWDKAFAAPVEA